MQGRSLLRFAWFAVVCSVGPAWAGPKVIEITLVQDGALVAGRPLCRLCRWEKFRSVTLLGNVSPGENGFPCPSDVHSPSRRRAPSGRCPQSWDSV